MSPAKYGVHHPVELTIAVFAWWSAPSTVAIDQRLRHRGNSLWLSGERILTEVCHMDEIVISPGSGLDILYKVIVATVLACWR